MILKKIIYFILLLLISSNILVYLKLSDLCNNDTFINNKTEQKTSIIKSRLSNKDESLYLLNHDIIDFEKFDNKRGAKTKIIPNVVHLIYLNSTQISFYQAVNLYSIYLNQKPDRINIHCDMCNFSGYYWNEINSINPLNKSIKIQKLSLSNSIFGTEYKDINQKVDVLRLLILLNYGGIYFEDDVFLVRSINIFRKYEMTVSYENFEKTKLSNQILIAHKNARFLKSLYDSYRIDFKRNDSFYNSVHLPKDILKNHTNLAHVSYESLGALVYHRKIFQEYWPNWKKSYCIHLRIRILANNSNYLSREKVSSLFIQNLKSTYGEMVRDIYKRLNITLY